MKTIGSYNLDHTIGQGSFAKVYIGSESNTGTRVAIKVLDKSQFTTPDSLLRLQREISLIQDLDNPFIASFYEVIEDEKHYFIVMEYVEHGNILDFVNSHGELCEDEARHYFCQLVSALEYLHNDKHICHRDLKAENVMLDRYNNIRLIDFGLSNVFSSDNPYLKTACGSPAYACPEMIRGEAYTIASDIWSAGILLFAMCECELPFQDDNTQRLLQKIIYTEPRYPSNWSPQLKDLITRMLCKDPNERITLDKIKQHPWFSQYTLTRMLDGGLLNSLHIMDIDQALMSALGQNGFDTKQLVNDILCGNNTHQTSVYRMLKKEKVTEDMAQISYANYVQSHINSTQHPSLHGTQPINLTIPRPIFKSPHATAAKGPSPLPTPLDLTDRKLSVFRKDNEAIKSSPIGVGSSPQSPKPIISRPSAVMAGRRMSFGGSVKVQRPRASSIVAKNTPLPTL